MQPFAKTTVLDPSDPAAQLEAYKDGRKDERQQILAGGLDHTSVKKELDAAYERGLRAGRAHRRGSVVGALSFLVLAVLVIATAVMVYHYGSFAAVGGVIDRTVSSA